MPTRPLAARDDLAKAEQELADAKDALAEVTSGTSTSTTEADESKTRTTEPLLPNATTDRVKQAEADFTAASEGITDQTPLAEAGAQFNAAAFALEVAWMRVYVDAGCLSEEQQVQAQTAVHDYTADLQTSLRTAGFYDGEIDGVYGPATVDAVKALQKESGLPETGSSTVRRPRRSTPRCSPSRAARRARQSRPPRRCSRRSSWPATGTVRSTGNGPRN